MDWWFIGLIALLIFIVAYIVASVYTDDKVRITNAVVESEAKKVEQEKESDPINGFFPPAASNVPIDADNTPSFCPLARSEKRDVQVASACPAFTAASATMRLFT